MYIPDIDTEDLTEEQRVIVRKMLAQCPALTSSIESYDKHLKTPQKRRNRPNGQQKPGKVSYLLNFIKKKWHFISLCDFIFRYFKFHTMPCRSSAQWSNV